MGQTLRSLLHRAMDAFASAEEVLKASDTSSAWLSLRLLSHPQTREGPLPRLEQRELLSWAARHYLGGLGMIAPGLTSHALTLNGGNNSRLAIGKTRRCLDAFQPIS
jgi:hypothetical protein